MNKKLRSTFRKGFSIVEVLVATGVLTIGALGLQRVIFQQKKVTKETQLDIQIASTMNYMKHLLNTRDTCNQTFASGYDSNALVIRDASGGIAFQPTQAVNNLITITEIEVVSSDLNTQSSSVQVTFTKNTELAENKETVKRVTFYPLRDSSGSIIGCKDDLNSSIEAAQLTLCSWLGEAAVIRRDDTNNNDEYLECQIDMDKLIKLPWMTNFGAGWMTKSVAESSVAPEPNGVTAYEEQDYASLYQQMCIMLGAAFNGDYNNPKCLRYDADLQAAIADQSDAGVQAAMANANPYYPSKTCVPSEEIMVGYAPADDADTGEKQGQVRCRPKVIDALAFRDEDSSIDAPNKELIGFLRNCPTSANVCNGREVLIPSSLMFAGFDEENAFCQYYGSNSDSFSDEESVECAPVTCYKKEDVCWGTKVKNTNGVDDVEHCGCGIKECGVTKDASKSPCDPGDT